MEKENITEAPETPADGGEGENKTYTEDELKEKLQSETDKRVTQALNTAKEKWQEEFSKKLETEKAEAERLAKLSEQEKQQELLKKKEKELLEKETSIKQMQMKMEASKQMIAKGINFGEGQQYFVDLLTKEDAETTLNNINMFKEKFDSAVQKAVDEKFKSGGRKVQTNNATVTKNPWKAGEINLTEQGKIYSENPTLAEKLRKEAGYY